jgi:hypothetical protein
MTTPANPNDILGKQIFEALAEKGLINKSESANLLKQLVEGTVKGSDWKLAIETAIRKPQNPTGHEAATSGN